MSVASSCDDQGLRDEARDVSERLMQAGWQLVTAESCTGGWVAKTCTDLPGSSGWFDSGVVSYSNLAKAKLLGVERATIAKFGAVSQETAAAMVRGIVSMPTLQAGLATTGIAGPSGGSDDKPVGLVCFAWALPGRACVTEAVKFVGDREAIRRQSVLHALGRLRELLDEALSAINH